MAEPVCAGCGKRLPRPSGRGRPATYHGPACRQRARRARLTADPAAAELLALLDQAGRAIADARRAVTSGDDPQSALAELAAVTGLVNPSSCGRSCHHTFRGGRAPVPACCGTSDGNEFRHESAGSYGTPGDARRRDRCRHGPGRAQ